MKRIDQCQAREENVCIGYSCYYLDYWTSYGAERSMVQVVSLSFSAVDT